MKLKSNLFDKIWNDINSSTLVFWQLIIVLSLIVFGATVFTQVQSTPVTTVCLSIMRHVAPPILPLKKIPLPQPQQNKFTVVLNGVLLSDKEKIAMINHKVLHIGDVIENMKILSIDLSNVKLQQGNQIWMLGLGKHI